MIKIDETAWRPTVEPTQMIGETVTKIEGLEEGKYEEEIVFHTEDGQRVKMFHDQDCCEAVYLADVSGDYNEILNSPILEFNESSNSDDPPEEGADESYTWTYYLIRTAKGSIRMRWFGSSNGYYSEEASLHLLSDPKPAPDPEVEPKIFN